MSPEAITLVSLLAPCAEGYYRELAGLLSDRLERPVELQVNDPWEVRRELLEAGEVTLGAVCSAHYVVDRARGLSLEPIVLEVPEDPRAAGAPLYFSDLVVPANSEAVELMDLRGARWAINEESSLSGYHLLRAHLGEVGEGDGFFREVLRSGSHRASLELVAAGEVDGAAIDSRVLSMLLTSRPELLDRIRPLDSLGPAPAPPIVASRSCAPELRAALYRVLVEASRDERGREVLRHGGLLAYAPAEDSTFDATREILRLAEGVRLGDSLSSRSFPSS